MLQLQRYVIYTELLKAKLLSYPDLESSMTNTAIGEVDDESDISVEVAVISVPTTQHTLTTTPLTNRSPANRYSYQQAVLNTTTSWSPNHLLTNLTHHIYNGGLRLWLSGSVSDCLNWLWYWVIPSSTGFKHALASCDWS